MAKRCREATEGGHRLSQTDMIVVSDDDDPPRKENQRKLVPGEKNDDECEKGHNLTTDTSSRPLMASSTVRTPSALMAFMLASQKAHSDRSLAARGILVHRWSQEIFDNGSRFIAHAAQGVTSKADIDYIVRFIQQKDVTIAGATHPAITAFRYGGLSSSSLKEGSYDDGEKGGGGKVLAVLRRRNVTNIVVIVSRWFGGTMLGPVRFVHITNAAEGALKELTEGKDRIL